MAELKWGDPGYENRTIAPSNWSGVPQAGLEAGVGLGAQVLFNAPERRIASYEHKTAMGRFGQETQYAEEDYSRGVEELNRAANLRSILNRASMQNRGILPGQSSIDASARGNLAYEKRFAQQGLDINRQRRITDITQRRADYRRQYKRSRPTFQNTLRNFGPSLAAGAAQAGLSAAGI